MICLEFRRLKLADPRRLGEDANRHHAACPNCAAFSDSVDAAERDLQAVLAVEVPDGVNERILLQPRPRQPLLGRKAVWAALTTAAIMVGAFMDFAWVLKDVPAQELARRVIDHVAMEPNALTTAGTAQPGALAASIEYVGGTVQKRQARVRYLELCPVAGRIGWHFVLETASGPATLIVIPDQKATAAVLTLGGWKALVRPMPHGYYALVTPASIEPADLERNLGIEFPELAKPTLTLAQLGKSLVHPQE